MKTLTEAEKIEAARRAIIVALDVSSFQEAECLVRELIPHVDYFKIGLELLTALGAPQAIGLVNTLGGKVFFDGKFDDIPNTIAKASRSVSMRGVEMFNVHASCGIESMRAAVINKGSSIALAVTVLTSTDDNNAQLIFGASSKAKVLQFARDAKMAGMDGVVCSPQELELLGKQSELRGLIRVTPGVRPEWAPANDQKRVMTPAEAIKAGADFLVIGRPITNPPESIGTSADAVKKIIEEIVAIL